MNLLIIALTMTPLEMGEAALQTRLESAQAYEQLCEANPDHKECRAETRLEVKTLAEALRKAFNHGTLEDMETVGIAFDAVEGRTDPADDDDQDQEDKN